MPSLLSTLKQHQIFKMPLKILLCRLLDWVVLLAKVPLEGWKTIQGWNQSHIVDPLRKAIDQSW